MIDFRESLEVREVVGFGYVVGAGLGPLHRNFIGNTLSLALLGILRDAAALRRYMSFGRMCVGGGGQCCVLGQSLSALCGSRASGALCFIAKLDSDYSWAVWLSYNFFTLDINYIGIYSYYYYYYISFKKLI